MKMGKLNRFPIKNIDNRGTYNKIVIIFLRSFKKMYRARKNKVEYGAALQSIVEPVNILEKKKKGKKIIKCKKNSLESL